MNKFKIDNLLYIKKINNLLFLSICFLLILIIVSNFSLIITHAIDGIVEAGIQAGGRIMTVSPCVNPPGNNPICTAAKCTPAPAVQAVIIAPFGNSASQICAPVVMKTTGLPITVKSVGSYILALFKVAAPVAIPLGNVGTPLQ